MKEVLDAYAMGAVIDEAKEAEQLAADGLKSAFGK